MRSSLSERPLSLFSQPARGLRGRLRSIRFATVLVVLLCGWRPAAAAEAALEGLDEAAAVAKAEALLEKDDAEGALDLLRTATDEFPESSALKRLFALAYLADDNIFWAIRVLEQHTQAEPDDCAARGLLVSAYLLQAALDSAVEVLERSGCTDDGPERTRLLLLEAHVRTLRGESDEAARVAREARTAGNMYREDRSALRAVTRQSLPDELAELAWRAELSGGYASNALMGSPSDQLPDGDPDSGTLLLDTWVRFSPAVHPFVRPSLEGQLRLQRFFAEDVSELSFMSMSGRLGVYLGAGLPRVLIGYRPELLLLDEDYGSDRAPIWFYESHRGEIEVEITPWLLAFGGVGRRIFSDTARTRTEVDGGVGGQIPLPLSWLGLLWAASGRYHHGNDEGYHLAGGNAILSAQARLPWNFSLRLSGNVGLDYYTHSRGYRVFFPGGEPERRRDISGRFTSILWSPTWRGLRAGVSYDFSRRNTTASLFGYTDHRVLARLSWSGETELFLPSAVSEDAPLSLPWAPGADATGVDERIQDLLRQDEQMQRSSSCVQ